MPNQRHRATVQRLGPTRWGAGIPIERTRPNGLGGDLSSLHDL